MKRGVGFAAWMGITWAVVVVCLALLAWGCDIAISNHQEQGQSSSASVSGPSGSADAGSGQCSGSVASVHVFQFGGSAGQPNSVAVGSTAALTCTPKRADGSDASPSEHGAAPEFFGVVAGGEFVRVSGGAEGNPFNLAAQGVAEGEALFQCRACGVSSRTFSLLVVP